MRVRLLAVVLLAASLPLGRPASAEPVKQIGYVTVRDGARLRYEVVLPSAEGRFPVALIWSPYTDGHGPADPYPPGESPVIANALLDAGYAILGVNMRGTGCSGGQWDLFQPATDGYDLVEWAAAQPWSTGDVGMFGFSAPGLSQLLTAATRPPHLRAITPADVSTDFYRDVAFPGGLPNVTFAGGWMLAIRPAHEVMSAGFSVEEGDPDCAAEIATRPQPNDHRDFLGAFQRPYVDYWWDHYSPHRFLKDVDVPLLTCQAWQDDQVTSRSGSFWLDEMDPARSWIVLTNGPHGTCDDYQTPYTSLVVRFFEQYVRGAPNSFETVPRVQVWHETSHGEGVNVPRWTTTYPSWPVAVEQVELYMRAGARLDAAPPVAAEDPDSYVYPLPAPSMDANEYTTYLDPPSAWEAPAPPAGSLSYTTEPLGADLELFGPGSADLWLSSTATDTDLQVTLTEVRPDGQEMYVQRGWLRASHRALDARSTELRPFHTHLRQDARPLSPLEPALARVEIRPINHVFRAGSALRLHVDAPTGMTGLFGFAYNPAPALNSVLHDATHPSRIVLGRIPGGSAPAGLPECGTLLSQPCR